jgi:hypothetical protein
VPTTSRLTLLAAIFFAFSSLGFISDIMSAHVNPAPMVLLNATMAGSIATVYAYGATGRRRWILAGNVMSVALVIVVVSHPSSAPRIEAASAGTIPCCS